MDASGALFYFAVSLDDDWDWWKDDTEDYVRQFLETTKLCEYIVRLVSKQEGAPNQRQLCYRMEVVEVKQEDVMWGFCNKVGDIVFAWDDYERCNLETREISYRPQCGINDGGCLNCGGCYRSLVVPVEWVWF